MRGQLVGLEVLWSWHPATYKIINLGNCRCWHELVQYPQDIIGVISGEASVYNIQSARAI